MNCQNCHTELPEEALFCNMCGADVPRAANYAAPEGFELDPGGSGFYYRYDTISDPDTGGTEQWVTWFNPQTGDYKQVECPAELIETDEPIESEPPVIVQDIAKRDIPGTQSPKPPATSQPSATGPLTRRGIPRSALIAAPILVLLIAIGIAFFMSGGMALFQRDEPSPIDTTVEVNASPAPSDMQHETGTESETESGGQSDSPSESSELQGDNENGSRADPPAESSENLSNVEIDYDSDGWRYEHETDTDGNPLRRTVFDENGAVYNWIIYEYSADGAYLGNSATAKDGSTISFEMYEYNSSGVLVSSISFTAEDSVTRQAEYDGNGNMASETISYDGILTYRNEYEYDRSGNMIYEHFYSYDNETSVGWQNIYEYDANGNLMSQTAIDENGNVSYTNWYQYDERGTKILHRFINEAYDTYITWYFEPVYGADGTLEKLSQYDGDGTFLNWEEYTYDGNGNMTGFYVYLSDGELSTWEEYGYDANGNMIKNYTRDSNGTIIYGYEYEVDSYGNIISYFYQDVFGDEVFHVYEYGANREYLLRTLKYYDGTLVDIVR